MILARSRYAKDEANDGIGSVFLFSATGSSVVVLLLYEKVRLSTSDGKENLDSVVDLFIVDDGEPTPFSMVVARGV